MKRAMFVGRWQPVDLGHQQIVNKKLNKGIPVLLCVCDAPPDELHPFTTSQTMHMLEVAFEGQDVVVQSIPDVESINYSKELGVDINGHKTSGRAKSVSISEIRTQIKEGTSDWKELVHPRVQGIVHSILLRN